MKQLHSYAKVWLSKLGNEILINGTNFFVADDKLKGKFHVPRLQTYIKLGYELIDEEELEGITTISYPDLKKKFGLYIYRIPAKKAWRSRQVDILVIAKKQQGRADIPENTIRRRNSRGKCIIEWDKEKERIRGVGEDFGTEEGQHSTGDITPWISYGKKDKKAHNRIIEYDSFADVSDNLFDVWRGIYQRKIRKQPVKELPVMITDEGLLLCMPYDKELVPKILVVGKTGTGKSFTINSLMGRIFYIFQDKVGLLNDSLDQFYDLMLPMKGEGHVRELQRIGNTPRPLPVINLYMSCPDVQIRYSEEKIGYRLTISFEAFLYKWKYYTFGVSRWDLGKAETYLTRQVIYKIKDCKTTGEIEEILKGVLPNARDPKKGDGMRNMMAKWDSKFDNIFRDAFTSNLFQTEETTAAEWVLKTPDGEYKGHPFIISAYAGLLPVINNAMAKDRTIAPKQMADLISEIVKWQMRLGDKKKRIWVAIDELKDLLKKPGDDVYKALDYLFTQGRFPKIGFLGNVQEYTKLSPSMRANSSHLIIFELQTDEERKAIAKDYDIEVKKITELSVLKKHQSLFVTRERTILYDKDGIRKRAETGGMWRGKVLPPLTVHKS